MPFGGNFHINKALTNVGVQYKNNAYIASMFLPELPVEKESDLYYTYVRDFRLADTLRANGTASKMTTWGLSTSSYSLNEHTQADIITDRDRANADKGMDLEVDTTEFLVDKILQRQEYECSKILFTTGSWGNNASLDTATSWAYNTTTSAPIQNVISATSKIIKSSGVRANVGVIGQTGYDALKENPNVYSRIQYVERAILTADLLAAIFDLEKIYVGSGIYDASAEGLAESITNIWGDNMLIAYFNSKVGRKQLSAAKMLRIKGKYQVKKWRDEDLGGDKIEVSSMFVPKLIATACAYYFSSISAS